jgi:hypothetical protein
MPDFDLTKAAAQLKQARNNCVDPDRIFLRVEDTALLNRISKLIRENSPDDAAEIEMRAGLVDGREDGDSLGRLQDFGGAVGAAEPDALEAQVTHFNAEAEKAAREREATPQEPDALEQAVAEGADKPIERA